MEHQISAIAENWIALCEEAELAGTDRTLLWKRRYLNPFAFDDQEEVFANITKLAGEMLTAKKRNSHSSPRY